MSSSFQQQASFAGVDDRRRRFQQAVILSTVVIATVLYFTITVILPKITWTAGTAFEKSRVIRKLEKKKEETKEGDDEIADEFVDRPKRRKTTDRKSPLETFSPNFRLQRKSAPPSGGPKSDERKSNVEQASSAPRDDLSGLYRIDGSRAADIASAAPPSPSPSRSSAPSASTSAQSRRTHSISASTDRRPQHRSMAAGDYTSEQVRGSVSARDSWVADHHHHQQQHQREEKEEQSRRALKMQQDLEYAESLHEEEEKRVIAESLQAECDRIKQRKQEVQAKFIAEDIKQKAERTALISFRCRTRDSSAANSILHNNNSNDTNDNGERSDSVVREYFKMSISGDMLRFSRRFSLDDSVEALLDFAECMNLRGDAAVIASSSDGDISGKTGSSSCAVQNPSANLYLSFSFPNRIISRATLAAGVDATAAALNAIDDNSTPGEGGAREESKGVKGMNGVRAGGAGGGSLEEAGVSGDCVVWVTFPDDA